MYFPVKAPFYSLSLFSFLFGIQLLRDQNDPSIIYFNNWQDPNSTCRQKILETQKYLEVDNVTFSCEALETRGCEQTHQRLGVFTSFKLLLLALRFGV